ncbi:hypothetical protein SODALDRAFT_363062 [Sodiomyces alkalinus F11]|uniref:BTB domain-containing protein n=1 Tax=Sodiomyces alkalinus (strain CBS 110278 / VKM F-3762 / F11) TaxID=1314773 RepID=A0A3N2PL39_SODAK|nr:hypothetical protein SODALDRAFT_363062 [Sodiomyces alkalinus F11]ROT35251.1 hypothetical protein SODALDRAFT_363062 [Sodiomyces alkalinus F11]
MVGTRSRASVADGDNHAGDTVMDEAGMQTTVFDPLGDLRLRCGAELGSAVQDFVVCSRSLARASPVLRVLTYGPFAESRANQSSASPDKDNEWVIDLPEDDPKPFRDILNIVHGRFNLVPRRLSLAALYDVLALTHKYDMSAVIKPWSDGWYQNVDTEPNANDPRLLLVARELGATQRFASLVREWAIKSHLNAAGEVVMEDGQGCNLLSYKYLKPETAADTIRKRREELVQYILGCWNDTADKLLAANYLADCRAEYTYLYGLMMRAAKEHKAGKSLLSVPAREWPLSVSDLQAFIHSLTQSDEYTKKLNSYHSLFSGSPNLIANMKTAVCQLLLIHDLLLLS